MLPLPLLPLLPLLPPLPLLPLLLPLLPLLLLLLPLLLLLLLLPPCSATAMLTLACKNPVPAPCPSPAGRQRYPGGLCAAAAAVQPADRGRGEHGQARVGDSGGGRPVCGSGKCLGKQQVGVCGWARGSSSGTGKAARRKGNKPAPSLSLPRLPAFLSSLPGPRPLRWPSYTATWCPRLSTCLASLPCPLPHSWPPFTTTWRPASPPPTASSPTSAPSTTARWLGGRVGILGGWQRSRGGGGGVGMGAARGSAHAHRRPARARPPRRPPTHALG